VTFDARWWFVSDLHLESDGPQPRHTSEAFAAFLETVVIAGRDAVLASGKAPARHLVMLGDTFDLAGRDAVAELVSSAERHRMVFDAWHACLRGGIELHFVCGNHDLALVRPPVRDVLHDLLPGEGVSVHPWILRADDLFFAEHGQQHHAPHRVPTILLAGVAAHEGPAPAPLAAWTAHSDTGPGRRIMALIAAARASRRAERQARSVGYRDLLQVEADRVGLSAAALQAVASTSPFGIRSALGVVGRLVLRRLGRDSPGAYLESAAAKVHAALAAHHCAARWYVVGHSHRATESSLDGAQVGYLNTGTWSADIRGDGPDTLEPTLFPFVCLEAKNSGASASLCYWRFNEVDRVQSRTVDPAARATPPMLRPADGNAR
jgi:UDP-2,3-diacylglucosamine pyrophosphatase LpxH